MEQKIPLRSTQLAKERRLVVKQGYPLLLDRLTDVENRAAQIPGGYILKIVWDAEGGYPEHAWGYIQYSARPFHPGHGCDGTTDQNIHLIAATLAARCGLDYQAIYREAYADNNPETEWLDRLLLDASIAKETVVPEGVTLNDWIIALHDLYDINNRSLVAVLIGQYLVQQFPTIDQWYIHYDAIIAARKKAMTAQIIKAA
jgi:hypothetical protein